MRSKKLLILILVLFLVVSLFMVSTLSACREEARRCTRCGYLEGHHLETEGHKDRCICCREGWPCIYPD